MQQRAIPPITLTAGQRARLTFNITVPDGTAIPTLIGALTVRNQRVDMTTDGTRALIIPPLPPGVHLAEVRAGGTCILYGHIEVLPSPLSDTTGIQDYTIDIDMTADVLTVNLTLAGGPAGEPGASAYQIWLDNGNSGTEADFLASLVGPQGPSGDGITDAELEAKIESALYDSDQTITRTAQGTDNYNASWIMLDAQHIPTGTLTAISIPCRNNSTGSNITYDPVHLTLQVLSQDGNWEPLAVSTNTVIQALNATGRWEFDNIPLDSRPLRACLNTSPTNAWNTGLTMGLRVSSRPTGDTSTVGGANYLADVTIETLQPVSKFTPAEHSTDSTIHITDAERQAWNAKADASALATKVNSSTFTSHTGDTVAHLSSGEHTALTEMLEGGYDDLVENLADDVYGDLIETKTYSSESDKRATFCELILDVDFSASGRLERVEMPSPDSAEGDWPTTPMWLALYEQIDDDWILVGVSVNSVVQEVGVPMVWHYRSVRINGNELKFVVTPDATHTEKESTSFLNCRYRNVAGIGQGNSKISCGTSDPNMIANAINGGLANMSLFYRQRQLASVTELNKHINDSSMHLSLAFEQKVSQKVDSSEFSGHTSDSTAHLTADEHAALTELLENKTQLLALLSATE